MTEQTNKWTIETYALHSEAIRLVEDRFQTERDRRYTEVNIEKEKALKIKETADLAALQLARESQSLKELQNDALRDKTLSESGIYATNISVTNAIGGVNTNISNLETKLDTALKPLIDFVAGQKGVTQGSQMTRAGIVTAISVTGIISGAIIGIIVFIMTSFVK